MPAALPPAAYEEWLEPDLDADGVARQDFVGYPASPLVNRVGQDSPELLILVADQTRMFGSSG